MRAASQKRVRTSQATTTETPARRASGDMASSAPRPPSVVAEPPTPTITRRAPLATASAISSPVPAVVAASGSFPSAPPASSSPLARAISTIAVSPTSRHSASTSARSGPVTSDVRFGPPSASSVPLAAVRSRQACHMGVSADVPTHPRLDSCCDLCGGRSATELVRAHHDPHTAYSARSVPSATSTSGVLKSCTADGSASIGNTSLSASSSSTPAIARASSREPGW